MSDSMKITAGDEWKRNWAVVLAATAGGMMASMHIYSIGVMTAPLEKEFGWSRVEISSGPMVVAILGVIMAPFVGMAIDRVGPRRIAMIFGTLYCGTVALLSTATASIVYWWILWGMLGTCYAFISLSLWTTGVSSLFFASRGLAQALTLCGTGLATMFVPLVSVYFLERFGWRDAYLALAGFWGVLVLPLVLLFFSSAKDQKRARPVETQAAAVLPGLTASEGFRSARFIKLALAASAMSLAVSALFVNMVPILNAQGLSLENAAKVASALGVGVIVGRVCAGLMLDRVDARIVAAVSTALPIPASLMLIYAHGSVLMCFLATPLLGFAMGAAVNAIAYLAARHFGMRSFGTLFGTITGMLVLWHGLAPLLGNWMYDLTHSYLPALWAVVPASALTAILMASMGRYPDFGTEGSAPAPTLH